MSRIAWWIVAGLAAGMLCLGHIGYFGGPVFVPVPATATPDPANRGLAAVVLSGDMGFNVGMGPKIANRFAADGVPVLGVNSLTYFRHERSPADIRRLVSNAVRRALAFSGARRVVLVGQSFGADMLHLGLVGLSPALRAKVVLVGLIVPTDTVFFRASPSELFNWARPDAQAFTSASQLTWVPAICIYGHEEEDSLCPQLRQPNVIRLALPGGHPLHRDVASVYGALIAEVHAVTTGQRNPSKP